ERVNNVGRKIAECFKGNFSNLNALIHLSAKEEFRALKNRVSAAQKQAAKTFKENLGKLNDYEMDLFGRMRLLDDLVWRKNKVKDAKLPFNFTDESLRSEHERFKKMVEENPKVKAAIEAEERVNRGITGEFVSLAKELGFKIDDIFSNPHYYRHIVLEYANAAGVVRDGKNGGFITGDSSDPAVRKMREILGRDYMKRYKGSDKDISTDYTQANFEVRAQMLADIEVMKTIKKIKQQYDKSSECKEVLRKVLYGDGNKFNQGESVNLSEVIPEGYEIFTPAGSGLVKMTNSVHENIIMQGIQEQADKYGVPIDEILSTEMLATDEEIFNQLLVLPKEIAVTFKEMAKSRNRSTIGAIAKKITGAWKTWATVANPLRTLRFNLRNFTGDFDAMIAGKPNAIKFIPRAIKELASSEATQDLQDFLNRQSGNIAIGDFVFENDEIQKLDEAFKNTPKKRGEKEITIGGKTLKKKDIKEFQKAVKNAKNTGNLTVGETEFSSKEVEEIKQAIEGLKNGEKVSSKKIGLLKKLFNWEVRGSEFRENILRYAAYLSYLDDMKKNKGMPLTYGASIKEEVLAIGDLKDRAAKMSNELMGAYDQVSEFGKGVSDMLIPFWRFQEVNLRRYYRLLKNGFKGDNSGEFAKRLLISQTTKIPFYAVSAASTMGKILLFSTLVQAFNRFVFPDDDDELPNDVKYRPHITLGKYNDRVYYFDRIGSLADAADWLNLDSIFIDVPQLMNGQLSPGEYVKKMCQAPVNKFIGQLNPMLKMPIELAVGRSLYPDAFNSRIIKDNGEHIASSIGMNWPYK
ncbi:MAG: hypothetical protein IJ597_00655, partial [Synergistaceae bacterium]|nr:hypothetical protein [Synergistaceae bacterium]